MADCYYHGQSSPGPCPECRNSSDTGPRDRPLGYGLGRKWGSTIVPTTSLKNDGHVRSLPFAVLFAWGNGLATNWFETNQGSMYGHPDLSALALEKATEGLKISTVWDGKQWTARSTDGAKSINGASRQEAAWRMFVLLKVGEEIAVPNELLRYIDRNEIPPAEPRTERLQ